MQVEFGLFRGDKLLHRGSVEITTNEQQEINETLSLKHRLAGEMAIIELRVYEDGMQKIKSEINMPIHESEDWESIELTEYTLAFRCMLNV